MLDDFGRKIMYSEISGLKNCLSRHLRFVIPGESESIMLVVPFGCKISETSSPRQWVFSSQIVSHALIAHESSHFPDSSNE